MLMTKSARCFQKQEMIIAPLTIYRVNSLCIQRAPKK